MTQKPFQQDYVAPRLMSPLQKNIVVITNWLTVTMYHFSNGNESFAFYVDLFFVSLSPTRRLLDFTMRNNYNK